ncbi:MAG: hypothetical protein ACTSW4_02000 [Candidatus Ranarchaeia archaeon]
MKYSRKLIKAITQILKSPAEEIPITTFTSELGFPPSEIKDMLSVMKTKGVIDVVQGNIICLPGRRLELLPLGFEYGATYEDLAPYLTWHEFEAFCRYIVESHGFICHLNYRFTVPSNKKRYEIDVLALRRPYIFGFDAKHWQIRPGSYNALKTSTRQQYERLFALSRILPSRLIELGINQWSSVMIFPMIISLYDQNVEIQQSGVVIPVFKLNRFLSDFHMYTDTIPFISRDLPVQNTLSTFFDYRPSI